VQCSIQACCKPESTLHSISSQISNVTSFLLQIGSRYRLAVFQNKSLRFEHINKPVFEFAYNNQRSFSVNLHVSIKSNCFTLLLNHNTSIRQRPGHFCYLFQTWLHLLLPFTTTLHFNYIKLPILIYMSFSIFHNKKTHFLAFFEH